MLSINKRFFLILTVMILIPTIWAEDIPDLIKTLKHQDAEKRASAAGSLGGYGAQAVEAVPALIQALDDEDKGVRQAAACALGSIGKGAKPAQDRLIQALNDPDRDVRRLAADAISNVGADPKKAVPALIKALGADYVWTQNAAANSLGEYGEKAEAAIDPLIRLLKDKKNPAAADALGRIQCHMERVFPVLKDALQNADEPVKASAALALARLGVNKAECVEMFLKILNDEGSKIHIPVAMALGCLGPDAGPAAPSLIRHLKNTQDYYGRKPLIQSLSQIGEPALDPLIRLLLEGDKTNQKTAISLISKLGPKGSKAQKVLLQVFQGEDRDLRAQAAKAMAKVNADPELVLPPLVNALSESHWKVSGAVSEALKALGEPAIPHLTQSLENKNPAVRANAVKTLGWMTNQKVLSPIVSAFNDPNGDVRCAVVLAIKNLSPPADQVREVLHKALFDEANNVRAYGASLLGQLKPLAKETAPILAKALKDKDQRVRENAAQSLGAYGVKAAEQETDLILLLEDEDVGVRIEAAHSLLRINPINSQALPLLIKQMKHSFKHEHERQAASAIAELGPGAREAIPALTEVLNELGQTKDMEKISIAAAALGSMGEAASPAIPALIQALKWSEIAPQAAMALAKIGAPAKAAIPHIAQLLLGRDDQTIIMAAKSLGLFGADAVSAMPALGRALNHENKEVQNAAAQAIKLILKGV